MLAPQCVEVDLVSVVVMPLIKQVDQRRILDAGCARGTFAAARSPSRCPGLGAMGSPGPSSSL